MEIKATTIFFKSDPEHFHKEKYGQKPNTVRNLDSAEQEILRKSHLKWICIRNTETDESFLRQLSDITCFNNSFIFSWIPQNKPSSIEYFRGFCFMKVDSLSYFDNREIIQ
jgi:hypothetical protein